MIDWDNKDNAQRWHSAWATVCNREFERIGSDRRVTHLSYADQGLFIEPTKHLGWEAHQAKKRGGRTDIGDKNQEIIRRNTQLTDIQREIRDLEQLEQQEIERLEKLHILEQNVQMEKNKPKPEPKVLYTAPTPTPVLPKKEQQPEQPIRKPEPKPVQPIQSQHKPQQPPVTPTPAKVVQPIQSQPRQEQPPIPPTPAKVVQPTQSQPRQKQPPITPTPAKEAQPVKSQPVAHQPPTKQPQADHTPAKPVKTQPPLTLTSIRNEYIELELEIKKQRHHASELRDTLRRLDAQYEDLRESIQLIRDYDEQIRQLQQQRQGLVSTARKQLDSNIEKLTHSREQAQGYLRREHGIADQSKLQDKFNEISQDRAGAQRQQAQLRDVKSLIERQRELDEHYKREHSKAEPSQGDKQNHTRKLSLTDRVTIAEAENRLKKLAEPDRQQSQDKDRERRR